MKKSVKITLCILVFFLLILSYITYKNWNTITAFVDSVRYTQEDVEENLAKNQNAMQEIIDKTDNITVRDLTAEESAALKSGELTEEDIVKILTQKEDETPKKDTSTDNPKTPNKPKTEEDDTAEKDTGQVVSELIAKLYVQKDKYLGRLGSVEAEARQEYLSLEPEERKEQKASMISKYLSRVSSWEKECDGIVYGIIDEIKAELEKEGKDLAIVAELKETYLSEKRAKKAYFISKYKN